MPKSPFVLALTLVDASTLVDQRLVDSSKIWVGVRNPTTNITHPNIVSVPTKRIPRAAAASLVGADVLRGQWNGVLPVQQAWATSDETGNTLISVVRSLLCEKLGAAAALASNSLVFRTTLAVICRGTARYPNMIGQVNPPFPVEEELMMINARVDVIRGPHLLCEETDSYLLPRWVTASAFNEMMQGKDVSRVGLDGFQFCVDGLCVWTTNCIIENVFGQQQSAQLAPGKRSEFA